MFGIALILILDILIISGEIRRVLRMYYETSGLYRSSGNGFYYLVFTHNVIILIEPYSGIPGTTVFSKADYFDDHFTKLLI